ncbi:MAG: RNA-binding domain-containing protein [Pyrodictiaceae archaeon]
MVKIRVEVEVRPTEDENKVRRSLLNVFEPDTIRREKYGDRILLVAESRSFRSLRKLHNLLRREKILDAARSYLLKGVSENTIMFKLNKQAAYMGRLSFVDMDVEAPMGPILFIIEAEKPMEVIDWLAPPTRMGKPIYEKEEPMSDDI